MPSVYVYFILIYSLPESHLWESFSYKFRIIPESAHSAYDKAAQYFNIKLVRVPVNKEFQADVKGIRQRINKNTILV